MLQRVVLTKDTIIIIIMCEGPHVLLDYIQASIQQGFNCRTVSILTYLTFCIDGILGKIKTPELLSETSLSKSLVRFNCSFSKTNILKNLPKKHNAVNFNTTIMSLQKLLFSSNFPLLIIFFIDFHIYLFLSKAATFVTNTVKMFPKTLSPFGCFFSDIAFSSNIELIKNIKTH